MLKLNLQKQPYWLALVPGVRTKVRPLTTALMSAAQAEVIKEMLAIREERQRRLEIGADVSDLPDIDNEHIRLGLSEALLIKALARAAIMEWEGVLQPDSDAPAPVTDQAVNEVMDVWYIAQAFWKRYTGTVALLEAEGNGSRPVANGTSAAGRATARRAKKPISPARGAKPAP